MLAPRTYETEEASTALHKVIIIVVNMISIIIVVVVVVVVIVVIICIVTIVVIVVMNMNVSTWYSFIIVYYVDQSQIFPENKLYSRETHCYREKHSIFSSVVDSR